MTAAVLSNPLLIEQGATWRFSVIWETSDGEPGALLDTNLYMQLRTHYDGPIVKDLSSKTGEITFDLETGKIVVELSAAETEEITATGGVFDLEVHYPDGFVKRLIQGQWELSPEVTK